MVVARYTGEKHTHNFILQVIMGHPCKTPNKRQYYNHVKISECLPFKVTLPPTFSDHSRSWATWMFLSFMHYIISLFFFSDEQNFVLRDAEAEVLFCFSLEESLKRAQVAPLFKVCILKAHVNTWGFYGIGTTAFVVKGNKTG